MWAKTFDEIPVVSVDDLAAADGFIFGFGTRFGSPAAQVKAFWDATGALWASGALAGKYGGVFTSTGSQHGGQETTIQTFLSHYVHHGINFVPIGFAHPFLQDNSEIIGGSPWGAGTVAGGDGSRQVSDKEKAIAKFQGEQFAKLLVNRQPATAAAPAAVTEITEVIEVTEVTELVEESKPAAAPVAAAASAVAPAAVASPVKQNLFSRFSLKRK
ncbi:hypothetical protein HK100_004339 [Physocladia obscura]|uniref:Flavodoxin-like domain-containing protein n=1 Tax=Physocladia obscura TaxID=109957 RepID=A0AAD5X9Y5_9FUNG|nr:hypothetical protein HK100_004339 [Physocladia obscura]